MDELPERASTVEMLWVLLVALFEQPAVSMEKVNVKAGAVSPEPAGDSSLAAGCGWAPAAGSGVSGSAASPMAGKTETVNKASDRSNEAILRMDFPPINTEGSRPAA